MSVPVAPSVTLAMDAALDEARAAEAGGEVPVGAVLMVTATGDIIARAQNRMVRDHDATSHAELLVLRDAARMRGDRDLRDCTLVVTLEPCAMCAGAIVLARVGALVFGAWDDKAGMCGSVGDVVRHPRLNHQPTVQGGVAAEASSAMLKAFFLARR